ncbi:MAG TPA: hypothetical protein VEK38_03625, partial [Candidatus Bathyarchaeia archaeon]|nr:hypothetical protein [Candidatus Bathyarchaeia archaeon]
MQDTELTIMFPPVNQKKLYEFMPSEGNFAGRKIQVLFVSYSLRHDTPAGTPKAIAQRINSYMNVIGKEGMMSVNESVVMIFRRIKSGPGQIGMPEENAWYEIASSLLATTNPSDMSATVIIKPDAQVEVPGLANLNMLDLAKPTGG